MSVYMRRHTGFAFPLPHAVHRLGELHLSRQLGHEIVSALQELGLVDSFRERVCHHVVCAGEEHLDFVV